MATSAFRLRPMGVGDLLDETIRLFRHNFRTFVGVAAIVQVPLVILSMMQYTLAGPNALTADPFGDNVGETLFWILSTGVLGILTLLAYAVMTAALTQVISDRCLNQQPTVARAYRTAWACFARNLWTNFLGLLLLALMTITIVGIPFALFFGIRWTLNTPAVVLEEVGGRRALSRSSYLVKGAWWRVLAVFFIAGIILSIVVGIPSFVVSAMLMALTLTTESPYLFTMLSTAISGVFQIIATPLFPVVITLLYYDLRVRKEGFHLQMLARDQ